MNAAADQPLPKPGQEKVLHVLTKLLNHNEEQALVPDLEARAAKGRETYGSDLMTHNGRSALMDWYQEALDGCMYGAQLFLETNSMQAFNLFYDQVRLAYELKIQLNIASNQEREG